MKCYFDGSAGGHSDEWLTIGGLASSDAAWIRFDAKWEAMLKNRYPIAPFVHMTDLLTGNDPFERIAGWTECKTTELISDVQDLFHAFRSELVAFACAVDIRARERLCMEGYKIGKPAVICAEIGLGKLLPRWQTANPFELAHLFYDEGETFIKSIRARWLKDVHRKSKIHHPLWGLIASVQPVLMKDTPGVQAADVIAWSFTRRIRNEPGDQWSSLATLLLGDSQRGGIIPSEQLPPITENIMRERNPRKK